MHMYTHADNTNHELESEIYIVSKNGIRVNTDDFYTPMFHKPLSVVLLQWLYTQVPVFILA